MSLVKIVATIGPETRNPETLRALGEAGMTIARLNGSHSDLAWHRETIALIRENLPHVPVLLDIPGPKIRTQPLEQELNVAVGDDIVLSTEPGHNGNSKVSLTVTELHRDVSVGDRVLADNGSLVLTITEVNGRDITCLAESDGVIRSGKGVHVPGINFNHGFISPRDKELIALASECKVDFIGVSFVQTEEQLKSVREELNNPSIRMICKVETQGALQCLDQLMDAADGLMIDRGDLSLETDPEQVCLHQKRILTKATGAATPVIVATEMLLSMVDNLAPTKAEISDITNAVLDGASALMLSEETAVGKYPVESIKVMRRIADASWDYLQNKMDGGHEETTGNTVPEAMGDAIALISRRLDITKIVAITISGFAAGMVSATMPRQPILAVSNDENSARSFNLLRGTKGVYVDVPFSRTSLDHIPLCLQELWKQGELVDDDMILVTAVGYPRSGNRMNMIETHKVSDLRENLGWK
jgi:pyruvate kinase